MTCDHKYTASQYPEYEECVKCATLHHLNPLHPHEVYEDGYWSEKWLHGTLQEQIHNCAVHQENGWTKNAFTLSKLPAYSETLLEIGCAPGSTLNEIMFEQRAGSIIGVEVDREYEAGIREIVGWPEHVFKLMFGYFPDVTGNLPSGSISTIIGLDVFEHSFVPDMFLRECSRLLEKSGTLFLMLPLHATGFNPRFLHREHVYLHSPKHMEEMLLSHGFTDIQFDAWTSGHEAVVCRNAFGK